MNDLHIHDPILGLQYGLRNGLTHKPGWEWVEPFVNHDQELSQTIRAHKVVKETQYKFGIHVPNNVNESPTTRFWGRWKALVGSNWNELRQINEYETFRILEDDEPMPPDYKWIPYHCVFDVKFDSRKNADWWQKAIALIFPNKTSSQALYPWKQ